MNEQLIELQLDQLEEDLYAKNELISQLRDVIRNHDNLHFALLTALYETNNYNIEFESEGNIRISFYDNKYTKRETTSRLKFFNGQWEQVIYMTGDYKYVLTQEYMTEQKVFGIIAKRGLKWEIAEK